MEVDSSAIDEWKEGGSAALLQVDEQTDGGPSDFPSQPPHGQWQIWRCSLTFAEWRLALIDAPVCCASCCIGFSRVQEGAQPRTDGQRNQLCELCGRRLSKVKHTKPQPPGRACKHGCKPLKLGAEEDTLGPVQPVRSHKRARSDPGQQPSPARQSSAIFIIESRTDRDAA
jgi:hypothetical protein